jgi:hypothetical protein
VARSGGYRARKPANDTDAALTHQIDKVSPPSRFSILAG